MCVTISCKHSEIPLQCLVYTFSSSVQLRSVRFSGRISLGEGGVRVIPAWYHWSPRLTSYWCGDQKGMYSPSGPAATLPTKEWWEHKWRPFLLPQVVYSLLCGFCALEWLSAHLAFPSWILWRVAPIMDSAHASCSWQEFSEWGRGQVFQLLWCIHINI